MKKLLSLLLVLDLCLERSRHCWHERGHVRRHCLRKPNTAGSFASYTIQLQGARDSRGGWIQVNFAPSS